MIEAGTKIRLIGDALLYFDPRAVTGGDFSRIEPGTVGTVAEMTERYEVLKLDETEFVVEFTEYITGEGFYFTEAEEGTEWERVTDE